MYEGHQKNLSVRLFQEFEKFCEFAAKSLIFANIKNIVLQAMRILRYLQAVGAQMEMVLNSSKTITLFSFADVTFQFKVIVMVALPTISCLPPPTEALLVIT